VVLLTPRSIGHGVIPFPTARDASSTARWAETAGRCKPQRRLNTPNVYEMVARPQDGSVKNVWCTDRSHPKNGYRGPIRGLGVTSCRAATSSVILAPRRSRSRRSEKHRAGEHVNTPMPVRALRFDQGIKICGGPTRGTLFVNVQTAIGRDRERIREYFDGNWSHVWSSKGRGKSRQGTISPLRSQDQ